MGPLSHHGQTAPLLPDDSKTAQEACNHNKAAGQDENISWDSKCAGGQQTQVVALFHYGPDSYTQNSSSTHLKEKGRDKEECAKSIILWDIIKLVSLLICRFISVMFVSQLFPAPPTH